MNPVFLCAHVCMRVEGEPCSLPQRNRSQGVGNSQAPRESGWTWIGSLSVPMAAHVSKEEVSELGMRFTSTLDDFVHDGRLSTDAGRLMVVSAWRTG